jgi:hypothetical protein
MRRIDAAEAHEVLTAQQRAGFHVDSRLLGEVNKNGQLYVFNLEDEESFLSLIWQESDPARLLTPRGEPRTLNDVGGRLLSNQHTFEALSKEIGLPRTQHQPEWFTKCLQIDANFDFNMFGWVTLVSPTDKERSQSPEGSFYVFDGIHKTLVLTKRLLKHETCFQPVQALFLVPRRG